ncbi:MAG: TRAP transporter substrate-binding protein, partial [Candidatus Eremiobacteraeota bacterium]|nr:TRAP transporter substrate-binding protein [Candidatus Eremiobacteraeota bacterium]
MMQETLSRRRFTAATLATLGSIGLIRQRASAAQFSLKFGTDNPAQHPSAVEGLKTFDAIRQETHGNVDIQLFPNNQLGGASAMLQEVRTGALHFMLIDGVTLGDLVDVAAIQGVGFAFHDTAHALTAFDGDLGAYVHGEINKKDLYAFRSIFLNGMRETTSSKGAITGPESFENFKIRVPPAKMSVDLFHSLGASPTPISFNDLYTALQTKVVDGQENPLANIDTARFYEVQKYLSLTNHMWSGFWLIGNQDAWNGLPADMRGIVERNFAKYATAQRKATDNLNTTLAQQLAKKGLTVNSPPLSPFR